jgi:hypothetical protein
VAVDRVVEQAISSHPDESIAGDELGRSSEQMDGASIEGCRRDGLQIGQEVKGRL